MVAHCAVGNCVVVSLFFLFNSFIFSTFSMTYVTIVAFAFCFNALGSKADCFSFLSSCVQSVIKIEYINVLSNDF